jgi:hypothetical protein
MAGGVYQATVQDEAGNIVPAASILVRLEAGGAVATIFSDAALSIPQANPITADASGKFRFYAAAGKYRITATYGIFTDDLRNVPIGEAQEHDTGTTSNDVVTIAIGDARYLVAADNLSDLTDAVAARLALGLGSMALEDAADYTPTSGLGTMAVQDADAVAITGGSIIIDALYVQGDSYFGGTAGDTAQDYSVEILEVVGAVNHLQLKGATTTNGVEINAAGSDANIDIRLVPKGTGKLNVQSGAFPSILAGADSGLTSLTDATTKAFVLGVPHYTNSEENICGLIATSGVSSSSFIFGGGNGVLNAATQIEFYTAANNTTVLGTRAMRINSSQRILIATTTDDGSNVVQIAGTTSQALKVSGRVTAQNGTFGVLVGSDANATTLTNVTTKVGRVMIPHYTNAEEPVCAINVSSTSADTFMVFGGGTVIANAATTLQFYTAASTTTLTGTEAFRVNSAQQVLIGTTTAGASKLRVNDSSIEIMTAKTPASAADTGTAGQFCWDASYFYRGTAANTWRRVAHATW